MSTLADLLIKVGLDGSGVDKGAGDVAKRLDKMWDGAKKTAAIAGAAAGAALMAGTVAALDSEVATDKLAASLGATGKEAEDLGRTAGSLYAQGWGQSMDEVAGAVEAVTTSIDDMVGDAAVEQMTGKVLALAQAFELDVARAAQVAGQVVKTGLAKDSTQALDLITASLQKVPKAVREDIIDAVDEYGPFLTSIGITGEKAFGLLVNASQKGMYGIDKTGDALKEFTILASDMSTRSKAGYDALGLSQEKFSRMITKGGPEAAKAFDQIVTGLLMIKDPLKQQQAALALFGTPLEDLSVSEIPKFLKSLDTTRSGLGDVEGATDQLAETLGDNAKTRLVAFKRGLETMLIQKLSEAIPKLEAFGGWLKKNESWVKPLAIALGVLAAAVYTIVVAMKIWTAVQAAWGVVTAISLGPVTLIVLAIVALIAIIVLIAKKTDWFSTAWEATWGFIKAVFFAVIDYIVGTWQGMLDVIVTAAKTWWAIFSGIWKAIGQFFVDLFKAWWGLFTGFWKMVFDGVAAGWRWVTGKIDSFVNFVAGLKNKITNKAKGMFDGIVAAGKGGINKLISLWNRLDLGWHIGIPSWVPLIGGASFTIPDLIPDIPMLADGGIARARPGGTLALLGEGGQDEAVVPLPRGFRRMGGGGETTVRVEGGGGSAAEQKLVDLILMLIRTGKIKLTVRPNGTVAVAGS
ncbi:phage tail tape measure protein [Phytohabitans sp. ZYX-F-186]|uniref:Phage tail tape measure protein n=1 Tax=Phytohabitans maris TaxID=3071409 RepID=A0ABU0ZI79_9ACTN|nr:phage tail tape measure protein [Phytohabitans sp. ZYX-F-186]MDQ7906746.1 phage tail tape measure protein [Phytohabitans sp. ZYX-F-186]